uniref:Protein kinase domain-containing protein n=1 Tax=Pseudo-nitzschia australis TaxID=44445 RepID=A0A7S4EEE3_9STRA
MTSNCDSVSPRYRASHAAYQISDSFSQETKLPDLKESIQSVRWENIRQQSLLGKGAFSEVYRVQIDTPELIDTECALKYLNPKIRNISEGDFDLAAIDLATEANLLSRLNHDNIIDLYGIYGGELKSSYIDSERGYFLVLDLLHDTLPKRLERYRAKERRGILSGSLFNSKMLERIDNIALGVSKGMEYLHNNGVIFMDLKPDNVGFNRNGKPVIFDFGFAREVHTIERDEIAGTLRYMSPDMALGQDPLFPSDVYSFGILLFEICTLKKPFKQFKERSEFIQQVFSDNYRPSLSKIPSKQLKGLISSSWNPDHKKRPNIASVVKILRVEAALRETRVSERKTSLQRSISSVETLNRTLVRRNKMGSGNFGWKSSSDSIHPNSTLFTNPSFSTETSSLTKYSSSEGCAVVSDLSLVEMSKACANKTSASSCASSSDLTASNSSHSVVKSEFSLGRLRKPFRRFSLSKS